MIAEARNARERAAAEQSALIKHHLAIAHIALTAVRLTAEAGNVRCKLAMEEIVKLDNEYRRLNPTH